jgi:hypothetical protein
MLRTDSLEKSPDPFCADSTLGSSSKEDCVDGFMGPPCHSTEKSELFRERIPAFVPVRRFWPIVSPVMYRKALRLLYLISAVNFSRKIEICLNHFDVSIQHDTQEIKVNFTVAIP